MDSEHLENGLTDEDRRSLCVMPTLEEVREAVFSIDPDSVAGLDGFGAVFFHTCWEIVAKDVFDAMTEFFSGEKISKGFTATTISLIPNTASPTCWSEYRLISLYNVTNKICTKLMTIRLGHVLPKVISLSQSGFVPGRLLSDNVLLAQEFVHSLESRRPDANVVFKLDMAKAYDWVSWEFLCQVLQRKGFPQCWIGLVANAISHCWFSVLVNGEHAGFFHSTRGLRQGDPLSPALFVLAVDYLSRGLERLFAAHQTMFYQAPGLIRAYERVSGQLINVTYLGVPLYKENRKACLFDPIISRLRGLLQGWATTNLSHGGRLALIRSVLQATPLHLLQVIHLPKSVLITIERIFNGFFWGSYNGNKHIHCSSWAKACFPVAKGGLGVRSLADYVRAFSMKLWWRFRGKSSLWLEYLHGRYYRNLHPTIVPYNHNHSSVWHRLCRVRDVAEPFIFWTLGEGSVSFLHDNWFGKKPLAQLLHRDTYTMEPTICQIPVAAGEGDNIVWTRSSTGDFSTKSAWEAIRQASPRRQLLANIWHRSLRPTISVFLWQLFQNRIPVDARMRQKGFSFPSKCPCCEAEETVSHLFIECGSAGRVAALCCHFWGSASRNAAKYRGVPFTTDGIILEVQRHLRTLYAARTLTSTQWKGDLHQAVVIGFIFRQKAPRAPSIVRWRAPSPSWFKLNTDGSSLGNPGLAGAAGIIRDSAGHVHLAYQFALGTGTSVLAELTDVSRGMELALTRGLAPWWWRWMLRWVRGEKFLKYMILESGIEVNPEKISTIMDMPPPKLIKEVQKLAIKSAVLSRFISTFADKGLPFFKVLRGATKFE
ncbi:UNVERIFIED_CONTAM: putative ribonuclease H protein [Sesamum angustifolium]|uniref:Ribonuclease H protein n=1 Tax=Sesamum angustifolium TaxID=2727405 RepID=A0AAW2IML4_9LAMI